MANKASISAAQNRVEHIKTVYAQCSSPYLFNKLVKAQKSLKQQKQKILGQQAHFSFNL